jgi:tRNA threonylcarbamoyladenosine biosynthesis protein TsaE
MAPDRVDPPAARAFVSRSAAGTERLGEQIGRALHAPALIALDGELGAGKTCFVRGLARGLGIAERVTSPTYTLMQTYGDEGRARLQHFDAYLEGRERAFLLDGGVEILAGEAVSAIEWAERVADLLPEPRVVVRLAHVGPETRRIALGVVGGGAAGGDGGDGGDGALRLQSAVAGLAVGGDLREIRGHGQRGGAGEPAGSSGGGSG